MKTKYNIKPLREKKKQDKIKLMWFSNSPNINTGFAKVTREICVRLAQDPQFDIYVLAANYSGAPMKWQGINILPCPMQEFQKYAITSLNKIKPHIFASLEDSFTLCLSSDTDVMTENGITNIKLIKTGDKVWSLNPNNHKLELTKVKRTIKSKNNSPYIKLNSRNGIDFLVTPEHRFFLNERWSKARDLVLDNKIKCYKFPEIKRDIKKDKRKFIHSLDIIFSAIDEVQLCVGHKENGRTFSKKLNSYFNIKNYPRVRLKDKNYYIVNINKKNKNKYFDLYKAYQNGIIDEMFWRTKGIDHIPLIWDLKKFYQLVGWYLSEGCLFKDKKYNSYSFIISQKDKLYQKEINNLLQDLDLRFITTTNKEGTKNYVIRSRLLYDIFKNNFGKSSKNKTISKFIFDYSKENLTNLYEALLKGDGSVQRSSIYTSSKKLRDKILLIRLFLGENPSYSISKVKSKKRSINYEIRSKKKSMIRNSLITQSNIFEPNSFCIELEKNHLFMAGRNGKFNWTGNSNLGFDKINFDDIKVVEYLPMDGEGIPTGGIEVLRKADKLVSMAHFTKKTLDMEGFDSEVIWHGVDMNRFTPVNDEQQKLLKVWLWNYIKEGHAENGILLDEKYKIKSDDILLFNYQRNSGRKRSPRLVEGLVKYCIKNPKVKVFLNIPEYDRKDSNLIDLLERFMVKRYGVNLLNKQIFFNPKCKDFQNSPTDDEVAKFIQASDIIVSLSSGEGCLDPNQMIITNKGYVPISKMFLTPSDFKVITKDGTEQEVISMARRLYNGKLFNIKVGKINQELKLTPNHKVLTKVGNSFKYKLPEDLTLKDYVVFPKNMFKNKNRIAKYIPISKLSTVPIIKFNDKYYSIQESYDKKLNIKNKWIHPNDKGLKELKIEDFAKLLGVYIAEGHIDKGQCILSLSLKEDKEIKRFLEIFAKKYDLQLYKKKTNIKDKNVISYIFYNTLLCNLLERLGNKLAKHKVIDRSIFNLFNEKQLSILLKYMWLGDGYASDKFGYEYTTVSKDLAYNICEILNKNNIIYTFDHINRKSNTSSIPNQEMINAYRIRIYDNNAKIKFSEKILNQKSKLKKKFVYYLETDKYYFLPIKSITKKPYEGYVYDIEVKRNESFCTDVGIVHNSGLIMAEGMSCAKPIVHNSYTTPLELLEKNYEDIGKRGELVNHDALEISSYNVEHSTANMDDFVEKIDKLVKDPRLRNNYGMNGRMFCERYLDWNKLTDKFKKVFLEIV